MAIAFGCRPSFDKSSLKTVAAGFIPWEDAKRAIASGEVKSVLQNHRREVFFTLKDGTEFRTREDNPDEVWHFIKDNNLRDKIRFGTE